MGQSAGVREAILRFCNRFSAGDVAGFAEIISQGEGVSVIGYAPARCTKTEQRGSRPTRP